MSYEVKLNTLVRETQLKWIYIYIYIYIYTTESFLFKKENNFLTFKFLWQLSGII